MCVCLWERGGRERRVMTQTSSRMDRGTKPNYRRGAQRVCVSVTARV